jgi:hypothetical protein
MSLETKRGFYYVRGRRIVPNDRASWPHELTDAERAMGLAGLGHNFIGEATQQAIGAGFDRDPVAAVKKDWDNQTPGAWLEETMT